MARKRMVTRTITTTQAIVLYVNEVTNETQERVIMIPFEVDDKKKALKWILEEPVKDGDEYVPAIVKSLAPIETKYAMPETDFIANSTIVVE